MRELWRRLRYGQHRERGLRAPAFLEDFLRDVRYGVRLLFRSKAFAIVAILTLGLGIGAATAVFSVVDGVLLQPLPYPDPDRIVRLYQVNGSGRRTNSVSEPNFEDWKSGTRSFSAMAEMSSGQTPVIIGAEPTMTTWRRCLTGILRRDGGAAARRAGLRCPRNNASAARRPRLSATACGARGSGADHSTR